MHASVGKYAPLEWQRANIAETDDVTLLNLTSKRFVRFLEQQRDGRENSPWNWGFANNRDTVTKEKEVGVRREKQSQKNVERNNVECHFSSLQQKESLKIFHLTFRGVEKIN